MMMSSFDKRLLVSATIAVVVLFLPHINAQSCASLNTCQQGGSCGNGCTCPTGQTCQGAHGVNFCVSSLGSCTADQNNFFGGKWFCQFCSCPSATPRCACERWTHNGLGYEGLVCVSANPTTTLPPTASPTTRSPTTTHPTTRPTSNPTPNPTPNPTISPSTVPPSTQTPTAAPFSDDSSTQQPLVTSATFSTDVSTHSATHSTQLTVSQSSTSSMETQSTTMSTSIPFSSNVPGQTMSSTYQQGTSSSATPTQQTPPSTSPSPAGGPIQNVSDAPTAPPVQLGSQPGTGTDESSNTGVIIGVVMALLVLLALGIAAFVWHRRREEAKNLFKASDTGRSRSVHSRNPTFETRHYEQTELPPGQSASVSSPPAQIFSASDSHFYQNQSAIDSNL